MFNRESIENTFSPTERPGRRSSNVETCSIFSLRQRGAMNIEVLADSGSVAQRAASIIAEEAWEAVAARGLFVMAVSGGHTPWLMLRGLASAGIIPWPAMNILQVDERVAPAGHADRNLTHVRESLLNRTPLRPEQIYAMPVESTDLGAAAAQYAETLRE